MVKLFEAQETLADILIGMLAAMLAGLQSIGPAASRLLESTINPIKHCRSYLQIMVRTRCYKEGHSLCLEKTVLTFPKFGAPFVSLQPSDAVSLVSTCCVLAWDQIS